MNKDSLKKYKKLMEFVTTEGYCKKHDCDKCKLDTEVYITIGTERDNCANSVLSNYLNTKV